MILGRGWVVSSILLLASTTGANAQAIDAFNMFTGVLGLMQVEVNQKAWQQEDPHMLRCLGEQLDRRGVSLASLVRNGVPPDDVRLAPLRQACATTDAEVLNSDGNTNTSAIVNELERALSTGASSPETAARPDDSQARQEVEALRQQLASIDASSSPALVAARRRVSRDLGVALRAFVTQNDVTRLQQEVEDLRSHASVETKWTTELNKAAARQVLAEGRSTPSSEPFVGRLTAIRQDMQSLIAAASAPVDNTTPSLPPSTSCDATDPITSLICDDTESQWLVLDYIRADYLLRRLYPDDKGKRGVAMAEFKRAVISKCKVRSTLQDGSDRQASIRCLVNALESERDALAKQVLRAGVAGAAEELNRPIAEHLELQGDLRDLGFLPEQEAIDGRYGTQTRAAIERFQAANDLPVTGLMSNESAAKLRELSQVPAFHSLAQVSAMAEISDRYDRYLADVAAAEADAKEIHDRLERVSRAKKLLAAYLPPQLRSFLQNYVDVITGANADRSALEKLDNDFAARARDIELAEKVLSVLDDDNRVLVEQAGGYVALYNSSPSAMAVTRNLDGTLVFDNNHLRACSILDQDPDRVVRALVRRMLGSVGAKARLPLSSCNLSHLTDYDVVLVQPGVDSLGNIVTLMSAMKDGILREAARITPGQLESEVVQRSDELSSAKAKIAAGADPGFGFVGMSNGSATVCAIIDDGLDSHRSLLDDQEPNIHDELGAKPDYVLDNADDAFVDAKRQQCGAIYADAADLRVITKALDRDMIKYDVWPEWFSDELVKQSAKDWASAQAAAAEKQANEARSLADQKALAAAKAAEHDAERERLEASLHQQYGVAAKALELRLEKELADFVEAPEGNKQFAAKYPSLASAFENLLVDHWELMSHSSELLDYGTATFKGRQLDLGVARSVVKLRNRTLGEYKDLCFITAFVDDPEFVMEREPAGFMCDEDPEQLKTYELGEQFQSRWVAQ
jgi:hypothetical protein